MKPEGMALQMRCSATTIRNYISGRTNIDWAGLALWARITGVDQEWLDTGYTSSPGGPGLEELPHLDSNQKPFGTRSAA